MSFLRSAGLLSINRIVGAILSIAISALSTRMISPQEYGALIATIAAIAFLMRISSLGIGQAAQFFGAKSLTDSNPVTKSLLLLTSLIFTISLLLLSYGWETVANLTLGSDPITRNYFSYLWIGIPTTFVHFIASLYSLGRRDLAKNFYLSIIPMFTSFIILCWAQFNRFGIWALLISWIAQYAISFILGCAYLLKSQGRSKESLWDGLKNIIRYGSSSYLVFLSSFFQNKISILTGVWFTTTSELAFFSVANTFAESLLLFYGSVGPLALSYTGSMSAKKDAHYFIGTLSRRMGIVLTFLSLIIAIGTPIFLPLLFGKDYQGSHHITWILLPSVIFAAQQRILENYLYGINKQLRLVYLNFINIFLTLIISTMLTPQYGAYGLALSALVSQIFSYLFTLLICWRIDSLHPANLILPSITDFHWLLKALKRIRTLG